MAELLVQDTSLIAVADAIRAKAESTASIPFPQGFIDAIESISAHPDGITAMEKIEYTPAEDTSTNSLNLDHGLGVAPNFVIGLRMDGSAEGDVMNWCFVSPVPISDTLYSNPYNKGTSTIATSATCPKAALDETSFRAKPNGTILRAGTTYVWYIGVIEGNW